MACCVVVVAGELDVECSSEVCACAAIGRKTTKNSVGIPRVIVPRQFRLPSWQHLDEHGRCHTERKAKQPRFRKCYAAGKIRKWEKIRSAAAMPKTGAMSRFERCNAGTIPKQCFNPIEHGRNSCGGLASRLQQTVPHGSNSAARLAFLVK